MQGIHQKFLDKLVRKRIIKPMSTSESLLAKYAIENSDGTYAVYDNHGNIAFDRVSKSSAIALARNYDRKANA